MAQKLPGAGLWPRLIDMHGSVGGVLPTSMAATLILAMAGLAALRFGKSILTQQREDARIAREETIREQVRNSHRAG